jgi:signal peptidase II
VTPKLRTLIPVVAVAVLLDQLTKWWVSVNVPQDGWITVIDGFFRITHARNTGMALGIFRDLHVSFFVIATLFALLAVVAVYREFTHDDRYAGIALGLIVGGAVGNLIDRITRGSVVDFLQFDLQIFVFPDFNVADSAITIGVCLLLLEIGATQAEQAQPQVREESEP